MFSYRMLICSLWYTRVDDLVWKILILSDLVEALKVSYYLIQQKYLLQNQ